MVGSGFLYASDSKRFSYEARDESILRLRCYVDVKSLGTQVLLDLFL